MNTTLLGRLLMSFVLLASVAAVVGFQWNASHVFNPDWHPHGRFHVVQLASFFILMAALGLWLLWRRTLEPRVTMLVVAAVPVAFWSAEFFAMLVPGTGLSPNPDVPNTFQVAGLSVYGNLFFSGVMIVLSVAAYLLLSRDGRAQQERQAVIAEKA